MNPSPARRAPQVAIQVDVVEKGGAPRRGWTRCEIGTNIDFNTEKMESYFFKTWDFVLYDALLVAAAVEFCDGLKKRRAFEWTRKIDLRIPVHEQTRWNDPKVKCALHEALCFLTGDQWNIVFHARKTDAPAPSQGRFVLPTGKLAVIPFSNGLDSCSVAGIEGQKLKDKLVRIRLGPEQRDGKSCAREAEPFTSLPYSVKGPHKESSARSRGFKFGVVSGLAAYLTNVKRVIMPESGQGALGPALLPLGQVYGDYRSHPAFLRKLERFIAALLGTAVEYELPRLWYTKGETLAAHLAQLTGNKTTWSRTRSCWQQNRHASVDHKTRQCGICAACLLRRLSVHAAGQSESKSTYVWEDLSAPTFEAGASTNFAKEKITGAMRNYAIAGALHLDHLAGLRTSATSRMELELSTYQLARACGDPAESTRVKLDRLLSQHETEWKDFMAALGPNSFLNQWVTNR